MSRVRHRSLHPGMIVVFAACAMTFQSCEGGGKVPPSELSSVPAWAREAVWYQIFPERFRNGDPSNDPTVEDIEGSWPHEQPKEWNVSRWTGDWYALQSWEAHDNKDFYYRVQQRRYGGDLQGVIDKLDYLKDLGITAIYFNPLFESPSLHKYDATLYHHIDGNFGPDPKGDRAIWEKEDPADPSTWKWTAADRLFLKLIQEAHARGIRVIIDGVFNHVGMTFWAFLDVRKNGKESRYKDWFTIKRWDDPSTPEDEFDYEGWYGVRELPEIREDANGLAEEFGAHVHDIVKRWMDPNGDGDPSDGIDGWRLDVAEMVGIPFWQKFRRWVRAINPEAYLVGEVWWEDWTNDKMFNAEPWLRGDVFDAVMNYRFVREVEYFFRDRVNKISASEFDRRLAALRSDYRPEANAVLMNLTGSHDTDRLASQVVNPDSKYDKGVSIKDNRAYKIRKPDAREVQIQKLIVMFQMMSPGAPTVYYGDEAGMWGGDDPDCRKPMLWPEMTFDDEAAHPYGESRRPDRNAFDSSLFDYYRSMISIRNSRKAISLGECRTLLTDDANDVYAISRKFKQERVIAIFNNADIARRVVLPPAEIVASSALKALSGPEARTGTDGSTFIELPPRSGAIYEVLK